MSKDMGASVPDQALVASPPSPQAVLAKGFDPSRMNANWLLRLINDWGCEPATVFRDRYPHFLRVRYVIRDRWPGEGPDETTMSALHLFAKAIAMEAARAGETVGLDPEGDSVGPQDIAQGGDA